MKYILFLEGPLARGELSGIDPDLDKKTAELAKDEKRYGKVVFPIHLYATGKFVAIVECDDERQIANRLALYAPAYLYKEIHPLVPGEYWSAANREHRELQEARLKGLRKSK